MEEIKSSSNNLDFYYKGPITSLCFQKVGESLRLLSSEGPTFTVYDFTTRSILHQEQLFPSCFKITDITLMQEKYVIVHTEKSLKVLDSENDYRIRWDFPKQSVDKIVHASAMVTVGPYERLRLITISAHNFVEVWDFPVQGEPVLQKR